MNLLNAHNRVALATFYRRELLEDAVPFWFPRAVDIQEGGFLHCYDADGTLVDSDKSIWAQGRMSWMLLTLYNTWEARPEWLTWGQGGVDFLMRHGFDQDQRMFFHVSRSGAPIRKRRYAYSESFASIACAALYRANQQERWREMALKLFQQFVTWNFTPGLMPPKFCDTRPMIGIGPRMIALTTAQSLRTDLGGEPILDDWIERCLLEIETYFVDHELRVVLETVTAEGQVLPDHFDSRLLNPGHAIEAAWFIMEEGRHRGDSNLIERGCRMLEYSWERGWDVEHGGLFYFRDLRNMPVQEYWHDMKFWWPHNEAVIATLMAYLLTGNATYAAWHQQVHDWSWTHFADSEMGEWFGYLHRDGRRSTSLKGNLWKSFFHLPRMLWKCHQLLDDRELRPN